MAKAGIMGGTFNPIHLGHVSLARMAYEQFGLDKVIFIPSGDPPHKKKQHIADSADRLKMVELAIKDYDYFEASSIEINRKGYSYTSDTLKELHNMFPADEFYFITGADSLFNIESWHEPDEIFKQCILLTAYRDDIPYDVFYDKIDKLKLKYDADIRVIQTSVIDISSTEIRKALSDNCLDDADNINMQYIDKNVIRYVIEHNLYKCED